MCFKLKLLLEILIAFKLMSEWIVCVLGSVQVYVGVYRGIWRGVFRSLLRGFLNDFCA